MNLKTTFEIKDLEIQLSKSEINLDEENLIEISINYETDLDIISADVSWTIDKVGGGNKQFDSGLEDALFLDYLYSGDYFINNIEFSSADGELEVTLYNENFYFVDDFYSLKEISDISISVTNESGDNSSNNIPVISNFLIDKNESNLLYKDWEDIGFSFDISSEIEIKELFLDTYFNGEIKEGTYDKIYSASF